METPSSSKALSHEDVVRQAVERNLDLLQHRLEARRAQSSEAASWAGFLPDLTLAAHAIDNHSGLPKEPRAFSSRDADIGLTWKTPMGTELGAAYQAQQTFVPRGDDSASGAVVLALKQPL